MSLKYRMMATFGSSSGAPFDTINIAIHQILIASRKLGTVYWPKQGKRFRSEQEEARYLKRLEEFENIFWEPGVEDDKIGPQMRRAVEKIEAITQEAVQPRMTLIAKIRNRFN